MEAIVRPFGMFHNHQSHLSLRSSPAFRALAIGVPHTFSNLLQVLRLKTPRAHVHLASDLGNVVSDDFVVRKTEGGRGPQFVDVLMLLLRTE